MQNLYDISNRLLNFLTPMFKWAWNERDFLVQGVGMLLLTFLIWYFGSVRSERKKEKETRIGLLNLVFTEQHEVARNLSKLTDYLLRRINKISEALSLPQNEKNKSRYLYEKHQSANGMVYRPTKFYTVNEISFISVNDTELFNFLYTFAVNITAYSELIDMENEKLKDELRNLSHPTPTPKEITEFLCSRRREYSKFCAMLYPLLEDISKKTLPLLIKYSNKYYPNKIGANSEKEIKITREYLEKNLKAIDYKLEIKKNTV
jgi:hypothetical protein